MTNNHELEWFEKELRYDLVSFTGWTLNKKYRVKNAEQNKDEITRIVGKAVTEILIDTNWDVYFDNDTVKVTVSKI